MGLLDRAKQAAASAKRELDRTGLLEHLSGPDETGAAAPSFDETTQMNDAIRRGAVDPRTLVTAEEVAAIAGHEVVLDRMLFEPWYVGVDHVGRIGRREECHEVSVCHAEDDERPWDPEILWADANDRDVARDVGGLGEKAIAVDRRVYVVSGGRLLFAEVTGGEGGPDDVARSVEQATRLLHVALNRLERW